MMMMIMSASYYTFADFKVTLNISKMVARSGMTSNRDDALLLQESWNWINRTRLCWRLHGHARSTRPTSSVEQDCNDDSVAPVSRLMTGAGACPVPDLTAYSQSPKFFRNVSAV